MARDSERASERERESARERERARESERKREKAELGRISITDGLVEREGGRGAQREEREGKREGGRDTALAACARSYNLCGCALSLQRMFQGLHVRHELANILNPSVP